jgi:small-conductance mechanosensitive channel
MTPEQADALIQLTEQISKQNDIGNEQINIVAQYLSTLIVMGGLVCMVLVFWVGFAITKGKR